MNVIRQNNKIMMTQSAVIMSVDHYFVTDTDHLTDIITTGKRWTQ